MSSWIDANIQNYVGPEETWSIMEQNLENKTPFCYVRFNEGESRVVANIPGRLKSDSNLNTKANDGTCEVSKIGPQNKRKWGRWSYNQEKHPHIHEMMLDALVDTSENYYASLCNNENYVNYRYQTLVLMEEHMGDNLPKRLLSAHAVHVKSVHDKLHEAFKNHTVNVICNEKGCVNNLPFTPKMVWTISNEDAWVNDIDLPDTINKYIEECDIKNEMFVCCAGPFTNILLHRLWKEHPTNYYIDAGSTLDYHLFNAPTRNWLNKMGYPQQHRGPELR